MGEFTMPSLGADMDEGTLLEWLVGPGDLVSKGDPVAVVETAKSTIEVECFESGTITELLVEPGATVPVGTPLALIGQAVKKRRPVEPSAPQSGVEAGPVPEEGTSAPVAAAMPAPVPEDAASAVPPHPHTEAGPLARHLAQRSGVDLETLCGSGPGGRVTRTDVEKAVALVGGHPARVRATPFARRLAAELGVDLGTVKATGRNPAVRAADVRRTAPGAPGVDRSTPGDVRAPGAEPSAPASAPSTARAMAMRRTIADLMSRANREIPHYHLSTTVDMAAATDWLHGHNRRSPVGERLLPAALLLKAAALAAREVPELNGLWSDDRFTPGEGVHLGVAVSLRGGGLLAPTLRDADTLALPSLMASLKDLVTRARTGRLRDSEVSDATITVTNLGEQGVESVFGVIHPPQVALVGFGRIADRPCAVDGLLGVRPMVTATLSADHRATDGAIGARYLTVLTRFLQHPEQL